MMFVLSVLLNRHMDGIWMDCYGLRWIMEIGYAAFRRGGLDDGWIVWIGTRDWN